MKPRASTMMVRWCRPLATAVLAAIAAGAAPTTAPSPPPAGPSDEGLVQCANLTYGRNKSSVCFSDTFLHHLAKETSIRTEKRFRPVRVDSDDLYRYPFAIMTGEGRFELTDAQRRNLKAYLEHGGFLLASAGCSNPDWNRCFRDEVRRILPGRELKRLDMSHAVFHTVFDVRRLEVKKAAPGHLEGIEINGKLVLIYSELGLNDTANAGRGCCCCGGSEIVNAQAVNANILAYALTH